MRRGRRRRVDGRVVDDGATVEYANDILGLSLPTEGPFETIGGLITHELGRGDDTAVGDQ